ncbi:MAG: hypothetical protein K2P93_00510 [Alphaproteobacteria bacterium]|nr:hypothetical protein [Alphaproteobacteria bacterium]
MNLHGRKPVEVHQDLITNRKAFNRVRTILRTTQLEAAQSISALSSKIDLSVEINLEFIKELAANAKSIQEKLSKNEKELSNIGCKVIATYWHSEQKFLKFIEDEMQRIVGNIREALPFKPEAVFINILSRHDICSVCSHTLVRSYTQSEGTLSMLRNALFERLKVEPQDFPLYITSSFREKRDKTIYNIKSEQLDSLERIYPAFPTLYIPLSQ